MTLYKNTIGEGPDLVMLHGWAMHGGIWEPVVNALAKHYRLHLVDLPGYGYNKENEVENIDEMVERLSDSFSSQIDVCGWSLGGLATMAWALKKPDQVRRLTLVSASPCFVKNGSWAGVDLRTLQNFTELLETNYTATIERFLVLQMVNTNHARSLIKNLRSTLFEHGEPGKASLHIGLQMLLGTDLRSQISAIKQSTLLIYGDRDTLVPYQAGEWLSKTLPNAQFKLVKDCAHVPFISEPELFSQFLIDFVNHGAAPANR
jgi:pimeloyl-[acyl-carrier protein] methyl ester esterase